MNLSTIYVICYFKKCLPTFAKKKIGLSSKLADLQGSKHILQTISDNIVTFITYNIISYLQHNIYEYFTEVQPFFAQAL